MELHPMSAADAARATLPVDGECLLDRHPWLNIVEKNEGSVR